MSSMTPGTKRSVQVAQKAPEAGVVTKALGPRQLSTFSYTDRAVQILNKLGIRMQAQNDAPILALLDAIAELDDKRVVAIARTLQQQSAFNQVVRDNIQGMEIANRHGEIVTAFDSIRTDGQKMVEWLDDGKIDFFEQIAMAWMTMRRGSIPDRFNKIKNVYLEVAKDTQVQVARERTILEAYQDYRFGLKQAQVDAQEVFKVAVEHLDQRKQELQEAHSIVEQYQGTDEAERVELELARDEALRRLQQEEERYQIVKDLNENLVIAYNAAEVVFARIQQISAIKERVLRQSVTFFGTNEIVFTALSASLTSLSGLNESTQTLEAMKDGMNKSLESLAGDARKQMDAGLRAGYGATVKAESLTALVDSIVDYQQSSYKLIEELREDSTRNAEEIERVVEDGKRRFADVVLKAGLEA